MFWKSRKRSHISPLWELKKWQGIKTVTQKLEKNLDGTEMRSKSESEMTLKTEGGEWGTCNSGKRDEIWAIIWAI